MAFSSSKSVLSTIGTVTPRASTTLATSSISQFLPSAGISVINPNIFGGGVVTLPPTSTLPFFPPPQVFPTLPPTPTPVPTPAQPASPTATSSALQVLIASVPVAQDGNVISADYHNAVRNALVAMANHLGLGAVGEEITVTNSVRLNRQSDVPEWDQQYGFVRRQPGAPPDGAKVHGWMEVELPDGARITKMKVYAKNDGSATLSIQLVRQQIVDPTKNTPLIKFSIDKDADSAKGTEGEVKVDDVGPNGNEEFRVVNNREHKYLLTAELDGITAATSALFHTFQIVCGQ